MTHTRPRVLFLGYGEEHTRLIDSLTAAGCAVTHTEERIESCGDADLVVSFGYRHIISQAVIDEAPPIINLHISLLPWNKGAHPNFWSFYDKTPAGVTIHLIDSGVDTGPILLQRTVEFDRDETTFRQTQERLTDEIQKLFEENMSALIEGTITPRPQSESGSLHRVADLPEDFAGWDSNAVAETDRLRAIATPTDQEPSSVVLVLAHLMDESLTLNSESQARANAAIDICVRENALAVVTSGWAYRPDSDIAIGEVFASFIADSPSMKGRQVIAGTTARDTVGDAIFFKAEIAPELDVGTIHVVSSDYHMARVKTIFDYFLADDFEMTFHGVSVPHDDDTRAHEQRSIDAFHRTFDRPDYAQTEAAIDRLRTRHPFYNGELFAKI